MSKKNIHVVKTPTGWQTKRTGSNRALAVFDTQAKAINRGTVIARRDKVELLIHGRDGKIRERNTFGNDPFPPKG